MTLAGGDEGEQREAFRHIKDIEEVTTVCGVGLNTRSSLLVLPSNLQLGDEFSQRSAKTLMVIVIVQERHFWTFQHAEVFSLVILVSLKAW